jgi:DNA-binding MarR family transcriptional regulator
MSAPVIGDRFTRDLFAWLDQVSADGGLSHSAFKLAYCIARHMNRKSGIAWPGQARLADRLGASERTVRTLVEQLERAGHLSVTGSGGRNRPNTYRLLLKTRKPASAKEEAETRKDASANEAANPEGDFRQSGTKRGSFLHETWSPASEKRGSKLPTNYLIEPSEEPSDSISANSDLFGSRKDEPSRKANKRSRERVVDGDFDAW